MHGIFQYTEIKYFIIASEKCSISSEYLFDPLSDREREREREITQTKNSGPEKKDSVAGLALEDRPITRSDGLNNKQNSVAVG